MATNQTTKPTKPASSPKPAVQETPKPAADEPEEIDTVLIRERARDERPYVTSDYRPARQAKSRSATLALDSWPGEETDKDGDKETKPADEPPKVEQTTT
jgi:hypothetical protein